MASDTMPAENEARVLLLPPTRRDAEAIETVLSGAEISCVICSSMAVMCDELTRGVGAILVAEEFLTSDPDAFLFCVSAQPVWSDLSTIVLSRAGVELPKLAAVLPHLGNVSVLERPVRITTLLSQVRSALRARERQYQVRTHLLAQQRAEEQRTAVLEAERAARSAAERAGQMKDEFLATLSHELRTPLNAILGWSHILTIRKPSEADLMRGLQTIDRNAKAQTQIIEDLLDMSRIISGKVRLDVQRISLATVVQAAVDTVKPAADAKNVRLETGLDPGNDLVSGDANRLQQVFWNLLSNAVKFTPRDRSVKVLMRRIDSHLQVSVIDTGGGIAADFLPHVFDRFRQADASTTRHHGGLGLGLAIVKQLAELHGGTVRAESEGPGKGATFIVSLPLSDVPRVKEPLPTRQQRRSKTVPIVPERNEDISGVKVLVVDDEPDSRTLVQRLLEDCQANVTTAGSAREAIELLRSTRPDVIISDVGMPGEDGYSLMRQVRALGPDDGGQTPSIALTAYARAEDRVNAIRAGFHHHLAKPVEPAELIAIVASVAGKLVR